LIRETAVYEWTNSKQLHGQLPHRGRLLRASERGPIRAMDGKTCNAARIGLDRRP
jgi:hypothetical protein